MPDIDITLTIIFDLICFVIIPSFDLLTLLFFFLKNTDLFNCMKFTISFYSCAFHGFISFSFTLLDPRIYLKVI